MIRRLSATVVIGMWAWLALAGCGDGYDNEDAVAACDAIQEADASQYDCMSAADHQRCVACYEDCGDSCLVVDTACPPSFSCPP